MQTTTLFMNYFCNETGNHIVMYDHNSPTKADTGFSQGEGGKSFSHAEGGHKKCWGRFYAVA